MRVLHTSPWRCGGRHPDKPTRSAFVKLCQAIRDRSIRRDLSILQRTLDALSRNDTITAQNCLSSRKSLTARRGITRHWPTTSMLLRVSGLVSQEHLSGFSQLMLSLTLAGVTHLRAQFREMRQKMERLMMQMRPKEWIKHLTVRSYQRDPETEVVRKDPRASVMMSKDITFPTETTKGSG